jgi:hypothetical protein
VSTLDHVLFVEVGIASECGLKRAMVVGTGADNAKGGEMPFSTFVILRAWTTLRLA